MARAVELTQQTYRKLRDFIHELTGIVFSDSKKYLLENRLRVRIQELGLRSFEEYYDYLQKNSVNARSEINKLFDAITINETYFFRNEAQFTALQHIVLPEILQRKNLRGSVRIWSAGCSTGEEPYTIAMIIREHFLKRFPMVRFEILANDLSPAVLEKAKKGEYRSYAVRSVPQEYLQKYFIHTDRGTYIVKDEIRQMVKFFQMNLRDDLQMQRMRNIDVIFCANVLIYFSLEVKQQVVSHFYRALNPGGFLFIGYSESLIGLNTKFRMRQLPRTVVYYKPEDEIN